MSVIFTVDRHELHNSLHFPKFHWFKFRTDSKDQIQRLQRSFLNFQKTLLLFTRKKYMKLVVDVILR